MSHNTKGKITATCFRIGQFPNVDLHAPYPGLTYTALTGKRKQSVSDAEKLLSTAVANWCKENGFPDEGRVVEIIRPWHKASDGRGLDEETRRTYNLSMLNFLLEDWMPWYQDN